MMASPAAPAEQPAAAEPREAALRARIAALLARVHELEARVEGLEGSDAASSTSSASSSSSSSRGRSKTPRRRSAVAPRNRKPLYVEPAEAGRARARREARRREREAEAPARRSKSPWAPRARETRVVSALKGGAAARAAAAARPKRPKTPRKPDGAELNAGDLLPPPHGVADKPRLHRSADRFGVVYRARYRGRDVAVKVFHITRTHLEADQLRAFRREVARMTRLAHDNVVSTAGYCLDPLCVVTDWQESRTLLDVLTSETERPLPWPQRRVMAKDLAAGMQFLHGASPPVLHRYLTPARVLVAVTAGSQEHNLYGRAMIGGFGLARVKAAMAMRDEEVPLPEEVMWLAPELLDEETADTYSAGTDMFAYGVILYTLAARALPWPGLDTAEIVRRVRSGERPPIRRQPCSAEFAELVEYCWHADPRKRPTFAQVLGTLDDLAKRPAAAAVPSYLLGSPRGRAGSAGAAKDAGAAEDAKAEEPPAPAEKEEEPPAEAEAVAVAAADDDVPPPPPSPPAEDSDEEAEAAGPPPPPAPDADTADADAAAADEWDLDAVGSRGRSRAVRNEAGNSAPVVVEDSSLAEVETRPARTVSVASSWGYDMTPSPLEQLLERDEFSLEEVMAQDEALTEVKMLNFKLIDFLARPENVRRMCRYAVDLPRRVTSRAECSAEDRERYRAAYVATELLAAENQQIMDAALRDPSALGELFRVLDGEPPCNPVAAVYLHRVTASLIHRNYAALVRFARSRAGLVGRLVEHIGEGAVMELLELLGWENDVGSGVDLQWMYQAGLVPALVEMLDPARPAAVRDNAARTLCDIVRKTAAGAGTGGDFLVAHLQSAQVADRLVGLLGDGTSAADAAAARQILPVVVALVGRAVDDADDAEDSEDEDDDDGADEGGRAYTSPVLERLARSAGVLRALMADPAGAAAELAGGPLEMSTGRLDAPLGPARLMAVRATAALCAANFQCTNEALHDERLVTTALDLFFEYPWNNMLHAEVARMLLALLEESTSEDLKRSVFNEGALVDRLLEAYEEADHEQRKRRPEVAGNVGHVMRIASVLNEARDSVAREYLDAHDEWADFARNGLQIYVQKLATVIGDRRPSVPQQTYRRR